MGATETEERAGIEAVRRACVITRRLQQHIINTPTLKHTKDDDSPVTLGDYAAQAVISDTLAHFSPTIAGIPIMGEEDSRALEEPQFADLLAAIATESGLDKETVVSSLSRCDCKGGEDVDEFWVVDPIDGTKGFVRGGQYAVCLALIRHGRVVLGLLGVPNLFLLDQPDQRDVEGTLESQAVEAVEEQGGVVLVARAGTGVVRQLSIDPMDGEGGEEVEEMVEVDGGVEDIEKAVVVESFESGHTSHGWASSLLTSLGNTQPTLRVDSQTKYALVATGRAHVYLRNVPNYREKIWDHAAGYLIVKEAGGVVFDLKGNDLCWTAGERMPEGSVGVIAASSPQLASQILQALTE